MSGRQVPQSGLSAEKTGGCSNQNWIADAVLPSQADPVDMSQLPVKVAEVQAELQRLDHSINIVQNQVSEIKAQERSAHESMQLLQQQLTRDSADLHDMQLQLADYKALKAVQDGHTQPRGQLSAIQVRTSMPLCWLRRWQSRRQLADAGPVQSCPASLAACDGFFCHHLQQVSTAFQARLIGCNVNCSTEHRCQP